MRLLSARSVPDGPADDPQSSGGNILGRTPCPFGRSSHEDQQCEQRIHPEIIGLPPSNVIQQVGVDATVDHGGGGDGVLALVVLVLSENRFREEPLPNPFEIDRISRGGPRLIDSVGGELEQLLGRKGVVVNVQCPELLEDRIRIATCRQARKSDTDGFAPILWRGVLPRRHHLKDRSKTPALQILAMFRSCGTGSSRSTRFPAISSSKMRHGAAILLLGGVLLLAGCGYPGSALGRNHRTKQRRVSLERPHLPYQQRRSCPPLPGSR